MYPGKHCLELGHYGVWITAKARKGKKNGSLIVCVTSPFLLFLLSAFEVCHTDADSLGDRRLVRVFQASRGKREASEGREKCEQIGICRPKERLCGRLATQVTDIKGAFHLGKKPGNFGGSKSGISDWQNVVPFGRKPWYVAVPDRFSYRGPGTGTNYEKRVNGTRNSLRKFQPGKRAHLFRFSTFSGNFPVGRTDETCSIYRRTGNPEILTKWKAPQNTSPCSTSPCNLHAEITVL